jgi:hypothetical protein
LDIEVLPGGEIEGKPPVSLAPVVAEVKEIKIGVRGERVTE